MTVDIEPAALSVLFATAEFGPWVKVGGLGEASSGLVQALTTMGLDVTVVMPDYGLIELVDERSFIIEGLPDWCPEVTIRRGLAVDGPEDAPELTLVAFDGSQRPNPYVDPATGEAWDDSTWFFLTFSTAVGALAAIDRHDLVHVNDWHTGAALLHTPATTPSVLTVHNLAYQGVDGPHWLDTALTGATRDAGDSYLHWGDYNPLAGAITEADRVVMVSETYCDEARSADGGFGLHDYLVDRGDDLLGIRNGIDLGLWHPADDPHLPVNFDHLDLSGKDICRKELLRIVDLDDDRGGPVIGMVARLVHQKGVDLALDLVPFLESLSARLVLVGSGLPSLAAQARAAAERYPDSFTFCDYDDALAHLVIAGSDLLLVPSRFEPCGLTQLQAMTCGTIPVVTAVGGLRDTVVDADADPRRGNGYVARQAHQLDLLDALHRAARDWAKPRRRAAVQRRGMAADWSWAKPARQYVDLYEELIER